MDGARTDYSSNNGGSNAKEDKYYEKNYYNQKKGSEDSYKKHTKKHKQYQGPVMSFFRVFCLIQ